VHGDAGHRGQRVRSRLSGRKRGTFASRLAQSAITRAAVPRRQQIDAGFGPRILADMIATLDRFAANEIPAPRRRVRSRTAEVLRGRADRTVGLSTDPVRGRMTLTATPRPGEDIPVELCRAIAACAGS
jgi:hypothetical protein